MSRLYLLLSLVLIHVWFVESGFFDSLKSSKVFFWLCLSVCLSGWLAISHESSLVVEKRKVDRVGDKNRSEWTIRVGECRAAMRAKGSFLLYEKEGRRGERREGKREKERRNQQDKDDWMERG